MCKTSVEGFLKKTGYQLNNESLKKLASVNEACNKIIKAEEERNRYKAENNFSISNIISMSDVSRDTVYNHDFYKEFIEYKRKDYVEKSSATRIKELEDQVARLRTENGQLHQRDGEFLNLKRENERLKKELERAKKRFTDSMN